MIYSDKIFSRKLERTEARANADFVDTRARLFPDSGATWIEVAGVFAMFDGIESPLTQTFGLGIFEDSNDAVLDQLETFFDERAAPVFHEVSPMVDQSILALLSGRNYRPIELTSVMYQSLEERKEPLTQRNPAIISRVIKDDEADVWAETAAAGWATQMPELGDFMLGIGRISARTSGSRPFIAELDGRPIAAAGFGIYDDVCILAGAATIPEARNLGAQNSLLSARLSYAIANGCKLAIMGAAPGSQSQKNAQKNGFNIAYTRTKWMLSPES